MSRDTAAGQDAHANRTKLTSLSYSLTGRLSESQAWIMPGGTVLCVLPFFIAHWL